MDEQRWDYMDKLGALFSKPDYFFERIKEEKWTNALIAFISVLVIASLLSFVTSFMFIRSMSRFALNIFSFGSMGLYPLMSLTSSIVGLVMAFIYAGLIHLAVKLFKGEGTYTDTFKVYAYSMIPAMIIGLVPIVGIAGVIYGIVLAVIGISKIHNISTGKAVVACIYPILIIIAIIIFLIFLLLSMAF